MSIVHPSHIDRLAADAALMQIDGHEVRRRVGVSRWVSRIAQAAGMSPMDLQIGANPKRAWFLVGFALGAAMQKAGRFESTAEVKKAAADIARDFEETSTWTLEQLVGLKSKELGILARKHGVKQTPSHAETAKRVFEAMSR